MKAGNPHKRNIKRKYKFDLIMTSNDLIIASNDL